MFRAWDRYRDHGLLLLRVGLGVMFLLHGFKKLFYGPEMWAKTGAAMEAVGITFAPVFWGFMAGLAEFGGGLLLIAGLLVRPALALMCGTMVVATAMHIRAGDGFGRISHPIELGIVLFALLFIGPGRFAIDELLVRRAQDREETALVRQ